MQWRVWTSQGCETGGSLRADLKLKPMKSSLKECKDNRLGDVATGCVAQVRARDRCETEGGQMEPFGGHGRTTSCGPAVLRTFQERPVSKSGARRLRPKRSEQMHQRAEVS